MKKLVRDFEIFKKTFVCDQIENLLSFDFVSKMFPNCNEISCDMGSGGGNIDKDYFDKFSEILKNINVNKQLKMIRIIKCKYNDEDLNSFKTNNEKNWIVNKAGSTKLIMSKKEQVVCKFI